LKGRFFNDRLFANVAVYWIDWNDLQVQANRVSDSVQFATNIGEVTSRGIEFEMFALPFEGLTVAFNGALNESRITGLTPTEAAVSGAVLDHRLAGPGFSASLRATYEWQLQAGV